jgi:hypothetical protein
MTASRTAKLGEKGDKSARAGLRGRIARQDFGVGQLGQESQNRIVGTGQLQPGEERKYRTVT